MKTPPAMLLLLAPLAVHAATTNANACGANIVPSAGAVTTQSFTDVQAGKRFYRVRAKLPLAP